MPGKRRGGSNKLWAYNLWAADNWEKVKATLANSYGPWNVQRELGMRWAEVDEETKTIYLIKAQRSHMKSVNRQINYTAHGNRAVDYEHS